MESLPNDNISTVCEKLPSLASRNQGGRAQTNQPPHTNSAAMGPESSKTGNGLSDRPPMRQAAPDAEFNFAKVWKSLDRCIEDDNENSTSSGPEQLRSGNHISPGLREDRKLNRPRASNGGDSDDSIDEYEEKEAGFFELGGFQRRRRNADAVDSFRIIKKARRRRARHVSQKETSKLLGFITSNTNWEEAARYVTQELSKAGRNQSNDVIISAKSKRQAKHNQTAAETASRLSTYWNEVLCRKLGSSHITNSRSNANEMLGSKYQ